MVPPEALYPDVYTDTFIFFLRPLGKIILMTGITFQMTLVFLIHNIYYLCCLCIGFYYLCAWCSCWFVVYIGRFIKKIKCVLLITRLLWELTRKQVNHISLVVVVIPTDRPKSVRYRCVIDFFVGVFVLSLFRLIFLLV